MNQWKLFMNQSVDHTYCLPNNSTLCYACQNKSNLVKTFFFKINKLTLENKQLKHRPIKKTSTFTWRKIKADAKMKFYAGINTIVLFKKIFTQPFLSDLIYWKGPKHSQSFSKVRHRRCNTSNKLNQRDEFLITLMSLRLGLLNEDSVERFGVSRKRYYSYIFTTQIKLLIEVLGKALIVWPPMESIREHLPEIFLKFCYRKCRVMIDCAKVFFERPKSLSAQAAMLHDQTTSTITHLNFWLELHPLGLFRSTVLLMGLEQVAH